tara:strand:+ start:5820 stop:6020 length:201 start_codon:yes stop_codon:yes gene_type:complete
MNKEQLQKGDLVKRMIPSHYTDNQLSDAVGIVMSINYPLAKVYFYDTQKYEVWNQKVLVSVPKGVQ